MKLYNVPRGSIIRLVDDNPGPPDASDSVKGEEFKFIKVDGMYSICKDKNDIVRYVPAYAEVIIVEQPSAFIHPTL